jgi:signal transduction histidine kinase
MAEKPKSRSERVFAGLTYLILLCCLIITILIINGFFEISRTRKSLTGILENQGETVLRGVEREIQNTVSVIEVMEGVPGGHLLNIEASTNFFALEDAIVNYLLEIASEVDQNDATQPLSPVALEKMAQTEGLTRIEILGRSSQRDLTEKALSSYRPLLEGTRYMMITPFETLEPDDADLFSLAIRRTTGHGIVVVSIDASRMRDLRRTFAIQNILEARGFGEGVEYVSIFDNSFALIGGIKTEEIGETLDPAFLKSVQMGAGLRSRFRRISEKPALYEIAAVFRLGGDPYGVIQVGLSTGQIQKILSRAKRSIVLSVAVLLALSVTGVTLIYINQHRHLKRLREMEERTHAAERLLSIGKLGAGLAHEIRNPLNAIGMAIQRLHREFRPPEEEKANEYGRFIGVIREEINRLNQIVDQFLLFSKPSKLTLAPAPLTEILDNITVLFAEEARTRSIVMQKEIGSRIRPAVIDKGKITQALINIVTNGLDAMDGIGTLTIKAEMARKDWVRITVADTGNGIPKDQIEKIFDYSYTTREKGVGLGLPIAHKIIEEHGGEIRIESRVGKGTAVSILLPVGGP